MHILNTYVTMAKNTQKQGGIVPRMYNQHKTAITKELIIL